MLRVIIGQGTASEVYQYTGSQGDVETIVIGPQGLWATIPPGHAMGQPAHLLALPGQKIPAFQAPTGKTLQGLQLFLDSKTYQENLGKLNGAQIGNRKEFRTMKATAIDRSGNIMVVKVSDQSNPSLTEIRADQVIIAAGIGPQKTPQNIGITVEGSPDGSLGFTQIEEGIDYMTHPDKVGQVVVVYGGAATGAWVAAAVQENLAKKKQDTEWYWMARPGGSQFKESTLPGDRNAMILSEDKNKKLWEITGAKYVAKGSILPPTENNPGGYPNRAMVQLTIKDQSTPLLVDQLIYCIGGNPAASGSVANLLSATLLGELQPLVDINSMVSDGKGTLAVTTPTKDLIIIGAATFNFQSKALTKQTAPMVFLPPNAKVPDGIAVVISTIEALNLYMPVTISGQTMKWNINFNTSNRTQIAVYLATLQTEEFTANLQVAMLMHFRGKNNFGLSEAQVDGLFKLVAHFVKAAREKNPKLDETRKTLDRMYGADGALAVFVTHMTTEKSWKGLWTQVGLNC